MKEPVNSGGNDALVPLPVSGGGGDVPVSGGGDDSGFNGDGGTSSSSFPIKL